MLPPELRRLRALGEDFEEGERAVVGAIAYAGLFEYPLTEPELRRSLLGSCLANEDLPSFCNASPRLSRIIDFQDSYFYPRGKDEWIRLRAERRRHSLKLLQANSRLLRILCSFPFTRMVALSGSIAHLNCDADGDLDLMVITEGPRLWSVVAAFVLISKLMGRREQLCLNFLLSHERLDLQRADLFGANQIIHLKPLTGEDTLDEFIRANGFVDDYYPCRREKDSPFPFNVHTRYRRLQTFLEALLSTGLWRPVEWLARTAYGAYLRSQSAQWHSEEEVILDRDCLKLHTQSHRRRVTEAFQRELRRLFELAAGSRDG